MRLLTINTHSLKEDDYERKLEIFCEFAEREKPDVIAMQEVNQSIQSAAVIKNGVIPVKADNHVLNVSKRLCGYNFAWLGIKQGYGVYDEGVALMTKHEIEMTDSFLISEKDDYNDWKTRKALGIKVCNEWFYSVHTGRFDDKDESFAKQIQRINNATKDKKNVWLMGDFNCPDHTDEYKRIISSGWRDAYLLAKKKVGKITVPQNIDGWRDGDTKSMRIDYVFSNRDVKIKEARVVFSKDVISDHYGVFIITE